MTYYRQSPNRSPYRSPVKYLESQREAIKDQANLRRALQNQSQNRRLLDEISLLKIRLRKGEQMEDKCQALIKQNALLTQQNDALARQLSERRYQIDRYRSANTQIQERDMIKTNQLVEVNKSLQLQIQLLKKQRMENNRLYEHHIQKLEVMLEQKVRALDQMSLKYNELLNQKEVGEIKFEEEINKLKNLMSRTTHEITRQYQFTREKQQAQKNYQIQNLKKNYTSQILLLEDQIKKLKASNTIRSNEFQSQLIQNQNLKNKYEEEVKLLASQNDGLRQRMLKLQQINRSQVQNIQAKYSNIHSQGQTSLKEQHSRQIKLLLDQIDKMKWLLNQKNSQIQNLVKNIRDQRQAYEGRQLQYTSQIETLKNKLFNQQERATSDNHSLMERINILTQKLLRESQSYHERAKGFNKRIIDLQSQVKYKQNSLEKLKADTDLKSAQLLNEHEQQRKKILRISGQLEESQYQRKTQERRSAEYQQQTKKQNLRLQKLNQQLQVKLSQSVGKYQRSVSTSNNKQQLLLAEITALKQTQLTLEKSLSDQQKRHSKQMKQLSDKMMNRINQLQKTQKLTIDQINLSKNQQLQIKNERLAKCSRQKQEKERELQKYIKMYEALEKYFKSAEQRQGLLFEQKSQNNIYQVLSKVVKSSIHIF